VNNREDLADMVSKALHKAWKQVRSEILNND